MEFDDADYLNPAPGRRAFRSQIADEILAILAASAKEYAQNGESETDLRDAPEYLLCVDLARGLTKTFNSLRYHLENRASSFEEKAATMVNTSLAMGKKLARFDLVLLDRKTQRPRYVIEVKRGARIIGDARRLMRLAALEHGRPRWKHGFLVTVMRRSEREIAALVEKLKLEISDLSTDSTMELPAGCSIDVNAKHEAIGAPNPAHPETLVYAVVFQLSLKTTKPPDPIDDSGE